MFSKPTSLTPSLSSAWSAVNLAEKDPDSETAAWHELQTTTSTQSHTQEICFLVSYSSSVCDRLSHLDFLEQVWRRNRGLRWESKPSPGHRTSSCSDSSPGRGCDEGWAAVWGVGCERAGRSGWKRWVKMQLWDAGEDLTRGATPEGRWRETTRAGAPRAPRTTSCSWERRGSPAESESGCPPPARRSGCSWPWSWPWGSCRSAGASVWGSPRAGGTGETVGSWGRGRRSGRTDRLCRDPGRTAEASCTTRCGH